MNVVTYLEGFTPLQSGVPDVLIVFSSPLLLLLMDKFLS